MIRGLTFKVPNKHGSILYDILQDIEVQKYTWKIDEEEIYIKDESLFPNDIVDGIEFEKRIMYPSYYVIFVNLQAYAVYSDFNDINSYEDFTKSECEILILVTDSIFVDVYVKDIKIIERIKSNAIKNNFSEINYISEKNDRNYFKAM
ncbi:MAG: DUF2691 family protein [Bacillota bacterium]|nr:DUF2691 family protein [Bacillota bacterium]